MTTVKQILSVDVLGDASVAVRYLSTDESEKRLRLPSGEAHALSDMLAIAISRLPAKPLQ